MGLGGRLMVCACLLGRKVFCLVHDGSEVLEQPACLPAYTRAGHAALAVSAYATLEPSFWTSMHTFGLDW